MTSLNEKVDFFGFAGDRLIYDERKKRFVHTDNLPGYMYREYMNGAFKTPRPDLIGQEKVDFAWKVRVGN